MIRARSLFIPVANTRAIKPCIVPLAEIAESPRRDAEGGAGEGGEGGGAGEACEVEVVPEAGGEGGVLGEVGGDFVPGAFGVGLAEEGGLLGWWLAL